MIKNDRFSVFLKVSYSCQSNETILEIQKHIFQKYQFPKDVQ